VQDPLKKIGVIERARAQAILDGPPESRARARAHAGLPLQALGSGSDFTPFLQHAGIASLNVGFGGEDEYGQYHSIYDSFDHYTRFMDPAFSYGVALARAAGRLTLRLAQAERVPLDFGPLVTALAVYVDEVEALADRSREEALQRNRDLDAGLYAAYFTPHEARVAPPRLEPAPRLNFAPLRNALDRVRDAVTAWDQARTSRGEAAHAEAASRELDAVLRGAERALTRQGGLPGRPWYRHQVYAPGRYTGYGVKTLPAVREAIELRQWQEAEEQIAVLGRTLEGFAAEVKRAARLMETP
jgi:N-acetylated-alpha-linked acidic dipeptidase